MEDKLLGPDEVWTKVTGKNLTGDNDFRTSIDLNKIVNDSNYSLDRILSRMKNKPKVVADIGAGFGALTISLAKKGFKVYAIEPSGLERSVIRRLIKKYPKYGSKIKIVNGNSEALKLKNESVDLCILSQVLEHVESTTKTFKEISRVLKRDGLVYICSPNYLFPVEQHYGLLYFPLMNKQLFSRWAMFLFKDLNIRNLPTTKNADFTRVKEFIYSLNYTTDSLVKNLAKRNKMKIVWSASASEKSLREQILKHWQQNPVAPQVLLILLSLPIKTVRWALACFGFLPMKLEYLIQKTS